MDPVWPVSSEMEVQNKDLYVRMDGLEGVPGLPGAPQDEAGLMRKFET